MKHLLSGWSWWSKPRQDTSQVSGPRQPTNTSLPSSTPNPKPPQRFLFNALHIFAILNFAVAEPLLGRLARQTTALENSGAEALTLVVLILCVGLPATIVLMEWLLGTWSLRAREAFHAVILFLGFTAIALPICKQLPDSMEMTKVPYALLAGVLGASAYFLAPRFRSILTVGASGIIIFPTVFACYAWAELSETAAEAVADLEAKNPIPVVLITFDEFCGTSLMDADRQINAARYPHFAELAREATWFRNASSTHTATDHALPAILTGNFPSEKRRPVTAEYPRNLFTLLSATKAYDLTVFEPFTRLCPTGQDGNFRLRDSVVEQLQSLVTSLSVVYLYHLAPENYRQFLPPVPRAWFGLQASWKLNWSQKSGLVRHNWDDQRDRQVDHFLNCLQPTSQPTLYFAHFVLPHFPWTYLPSGKQYRSSGGLSFPEMEVIAQAGPVSQNWGNDDLLVTHGYQRYLQQVRFADTILGRLVARLKEVNLYDRCLLIVVADHGVSFRINQSRRIPTESNLADIMSVPFFVKRPEQKSGSISDRNVMTIDIVPTIMDVLGVTLPFAKDGTSVFDTSDPERAKKVFYNDGRQVTIDASFESRYDTLQEMLARFGTGSDPNNLYRVGPHAALVGKDVSDLNVGAPPDFKLHLKHPLSFTHHAQNKDSPCYLEGNVALERDDPRLPVELAIGVNGKIRAATRTYAIPGLFATWSALIPESSLREGENEVRIFIVNKTENELTLRPCYP